MQGNMEYHIIFSPLFTFDEVLVRFEFNPRKGLLCLLQATNMGFVTLMRFSFQVLTVEIFRDRNTLYGFTLHSEGILQLWDLTKMQHVYKFEGLLDVGEYAEDGKLCVCKQSEGSGFDPLRPSFCIGIGLCLDSSWKVKDIAFFSN